MFEVGRKYMFFTDDGDGVGSWAAAVLDWSAPLVKIDYLGSYQIINTAAPQFVRAEPCDDIAKAAKDARAATRPSIYAPRAPVTPK